MGKRLRIELDDDLYQWLERQAFKHKLTEAQVVIDVLIKRRKDLKRYMDEWNERTNTPYKAYVQRERCRIAVRKSQQNKKLIKKLFGMEVE